MTAHPLLDVRELPVHPADYLTTHGEVFARWDHRSQDSGNVSYGVRIAGERFFVKTAGDEAPPPPGAPVPYFDHAGRVRLLHKAIEIAGAVTHPAVPALRAVIDSAIGPVLVHDFADGELLHARRERRDDPDGAHYRFLMLPADELLSALGVLLSLHHDLAASGWVAHDLYDGSLLYDFTTGRLSVVDLDNYSHGPTHNTMGRMFGSTRYMAPEQFLLGARVDERTTVFTLGRMCQYFGTRGSGRPDRFAGPAGLFETLSAATAPDPVHRLQTVAELVDAWQQALGE